jgi:hypothetical protein
VITFPAYAANFELYPKDGEVARHLTPLFETLQRIDFTLRVDDPGVNQGQMASDFDAALEQALLARGAEHLQLRLPPEISQELDFAFTFAGRSVAVEIEKTNREKVLRDILKCHMYLEAGANFALVGLPKNYAHSRGMWDLYDFGVQRFGECLTYGFGTTDRLGRILLLGYEQFVGTSGLRISKRTRLEMRKLAASQGGRT